MSDEKIENRRTFIEERVRKIEEMLCYTNIDVNIRDNLEQERENLLEEYDKLPCKLPPQEVNSYPIYLQTESPFVYKHKEYNWTIKKVNNKWALYDEDVNEVVTDDIVEENGIPVKAITTKQNIDTKGRLVRSIHELKIDVPEPKPTRIKINEQDRASILKQLKKQSEGVDYRNLPYGKLKIDLMVAVGFATGKYVSECVRCGKKPRAIQDLEIDHVLGNGAEERKKFPNYMDYCIHILEEVLNGSKDYQLLCKKCHAKKTRLEALQARNSKSRKRVLGMQRALTRTG
jgi:hypothetical protein